VNPSLWNPRVAFALALAGVFLVAPVRARAGAELELDVGRIADSALIDVAIFHDPRPGPELDAIAPISGSCVLDPDEACVGGPGIRKLLRFDVLVHSIGDQDLFIGDPTARPDLFRFSACHHHYHFQQAALYELLDTSGRQIATGRKQGFCMEDTVPSVPGSGLRRRYNCENQGISVGFADLYPWFLDCQWIDVTDVPPGDYALHVVWNPDKLLPEERFDNNAGTVPVTLFPATEAAPIVGAIRRPRSGTRATAGRPLQISWSASDDRGIATQEVWFSADDGATWTELVGDVPATRRSWSWAVPPSLATAQARIRVVARDFSVERGERTSERFVVIRPRGRLATLAR
jgi:Lysyl oxidase/Bacterial Ig domain